MRTARLLHAFPTMFEHKSQQLASPEVYKKRIWFYFFIAMGMITFSMLLGMVGYKYIIGVKGWDDAFYNASMILTGMGPVVDSSITISTAGKIFSGFYAIYSGVIFLTSIAIFFSPVIHRFFHAMHVDIDDKE